MDNGLLINFGGEQLDYSKKELESKVVLEENLSNNYNGTRNSIKRA